MPEKQEKASGFALIRCSQRGSKLESNIVSVGLNGRPFNIERGKLVPVPMGVVGVLENAVQPVYSDDEADPESGRKKFIGMAPRYTFTIEKKFDEETYEKLRTIALKRDLTPGDLKAVGL